MTDTALINPKLFVVLDKEGRERTFILSKFPAVQGREIVTKYPIAALPKLGDYKVSEETMLKLMNYVGIMSGEREMRLSNMTLVNQHCGDWQTLAKLEMAMMEYNCSFFSDGTASNFLADVVQKTLAKISEILTLSSAASSQTEKQPSTNSAQSTA